MRKNLCKDIIQSKSQQTRWGSRWVVACGGNAVRRLILMAVRGFWIALLFAICTLIASPTIAQSTSTETWSGSASVDNGANECANVTFACNGSISGTITTTLVPNPPNGTIGPVATTSLPA